jgi:hypothetical protein
MSVPLWVSELASGFWADAGAAEPFPRQLCLSARRALPVDVVCLPGLCVSGVLAWLRQRQIVLALAGPDRALRGCLVASKGYGVVFLDQLDGDEEQGFSLAHELAHFLRDYLRPRRRAAAQLGPQALEVFDGLRPPRPEERLHALLRAVPIGFHTHLMARDAAGAPEGSEAACERAADRLAYELLAPADAVRAAVGTEGTRATAVLREVFGLPAAQAVHYAALLFPPELPPDRLVRRLRAARPDLSNFERRGGK